MIKTNAYIPSVLRGYQNHIRVIEGKSEKTIYEYTGDLLRFFKYLVMCKLEDTKYSEVTDELLKRNLKEKDILNVTAEDINLYMYFLKDDLQNETITRKRSLASIKGFYKYLKTVTKDIVVSPAEEIKSPKIGHHDPKFLEIPQCEELMDSVIDNSRFMERDVCIIVLALHLGLRRGELHSLDLADYYRVNQVLRIKGKGNKERILPLNETCIEALEDYIAVRPVLSVDNPSRKALFISRNNNRMSSSAIYRMVKKYCAIIGLDPDISPHNLRDTAATGLLNAGVNIRVIQEILGHTSLNTTQKYTCISDERKSEAIHSHPLNYYNQGGDTNES